MTFTSYSQNFEDVLLWRALGHVERGRYLDVGAQDPEVDSVSLSFYERGWRGLHVEPTTEFAEKLRLARPDETVIQAAVTTASSPISFYEFSGTGLSTGKADIADAHRDEGFEGRVSLVPTITLSSLLEQAPVFHWLKIDVEGMEADVLASWGDHPSRPWVVLVEATYPGKEVHTDQLWRPEMVSRDYDEVYFDGLSRYFVHRSQAGLKDAFSIPPNVFDRFAVNTNHFVAGQMRAQADEARRRDAELTRSVGSLEKRLDRASRDFDLMSIALEEGRDRARDLQRAIVRETDERVAAEQRVVASLERAEKLRQAERAVWERRLREQENLAEERRGRDLEQAEARRQFEQGEHQQLLEEERQSLARLAAEHLALAREAEQQRALLQHAEALITAAMAVPVGRWRRFGQRLGLAGTSPWRKQLQPWRGTVAQHNISGPTGAMTVNSAPDLPAGNPFLRANSMLELLAWDDVSFVRCAFVTLLGRQPDPLGEAHYTRMIRQGRSKYEVLWALRRSPEAKTHDPGISGLDRQIRRAALARRPVAGILLRWLARVEGDSLSERRDRALRNEIVQMRGDVARLTLASGNAQSNRASVDGGSNDLPATAELLAGSPLLASGSLSGNASAVHRLITAAAGR